METQVPHNPMLRVMSLHDFRLLFVGTTTSILGDQFALVATPWLTLQLTGDPLALALSWRWRAFRARYLCFWVRPSRIVSHRV